MDMEIPDLEELEWLESNSNLQLPEEEVEEEEEEEYYLRGYVDADTIAAAEPEAVVNNNISNKRPRSDLGVSDDDNNVTNVRVSKKVEEDTDDNVTNVRVRVRVSKKEVEDDNITNVRVSKKEVEVEEESIKYVSRYASEIDGDCMPITAPSSSSSSGFAERVYAKLHSPSSTFPSLKTLSPSSSGLISHPITTLLQKAEQDVVLKALQATSEVQNISPKASFVSKELWVNKYSPKSFTELLSDENTNREVLMWLKQWDHAVFGADIRSTGEEVLSALRRHSSIPRHQKHSDTSSMRKNTAFSSIEKHGGQDNVKFKGVQGLQNKKLKGSGTPDEKVLLLCGPPGLGKTTLAHVIAKHCGYHVVEINASDDRSSTIIEAKILDAVQMNSVMADSKPKCLVIDEIDGALGEGKGAVEIIVKMVAADRKTSAWKETSATEGLSGSSSRKERKAARLTRPVICICNDLYAPSLRPLRPIAKVHVFAQPTVSRVVSRLKYICDKERVKTSSIALTALAEYTECDIRSCLNTLQFLHMKKEPLNLGALNSQVIGRKDITRSLFDIWKEVFQKRKTKATHKHNTSQMKTYDTNDSLYSMISVRGDHELIVDGIHENFLNLHYHDPMLHKTVDCLNALGISDLLHQCFMRSHNTSLYAYHPPITVTIHRLLAHVERPSIDWPKSFHRHRMMTIEKIEILKSWRSKILPYISRHLSVHSFVEDTVSSLLHILSPPDLRPVAMHLLSEKENTDLAQLVSNMVSYSLTYKNTRSEQSRNISKHDGMMEPSSLVFDPPIHDFSRFKEIKPGHCELKSALKQVIMHEVEKQNILQKSSARFMIDTDCPRKGNNVASSTAIGMPESLKVDAAACVGVKGGKPNMSKGAYESSIKKGMSDGHSESVKLNSKKVNPTGSFNFFDRFRNLHSKGHQNVDPAKRTAEESDGCPLLFKFNEGFTNAVKKPVRVREFLL